MKNDRSTENAPAIDFSNLGERLKELFFKNAIFANFIFNEFLRFCDFRKKAEISFFQF